MGLINSLEGAALLCLKNGDKVKAKFFYEAATSLRKEIKAPMNYVENVSHEENLKKLNVGEVKDIDIDIDNDIDEVLKSALEVLVE
jgi:hypothetical protein